MLRLFRFLIFGDGHKHKWVIIQKGSFEAWSDGFYWVKMCEECGKLKNHKIKF